MIHNPDILTTFLGSGFGSEFTDISALPGMDGYGELSSGYTSKTVFEGISMRADFFGMRKGKIGTFVVILYKEGTIPSVTIQEIARILDTRISTRVP